MAPGRLHPALRGAAGDRRPAGRPVRQAPAVPARSRRIHPGLGPVRARPRARLADRGPGAPGLARSAAHPAGVRHPQGGLPGGGTAAGTGPVRSGDGPVRGRRPGPRRSAHPGGRVRRGMAADLPGQRSARARRLGGRIALDPAGHTHRRTAVGHTRDAAGRNGLRRAGVPTGSGPRTGLARLEPPPGGRGTGRLLAVHPVPAPPAVAAGPPQPAAQPRLHQRDPGRRGVLRLVHRADAGPVGLPAGTAGAVPQSAGLSIAPSPSASPSRPARRERWPSGVDGR